MPVAGRVSAQWPASATGRPPPRSPPAGGPRSTRGQPRPAMGGAYSVNWAHWHWTPLASQAPTESPASTWPMSVKCAHKRGVAPRNLQRAIPLTLTSALHQARGRALTFRGTDRPHSPAAEGPHGPEEGGSIITSRFEPSLPPSRHPRECGATSKVCTIRLGDRNPHRA